MKKIKLSYIFYAVIILEGCLINSTLILSMMIAFAISLIISVFCFGLLINNEEDILNILNEESTKNNANEILFILSGLEMTITAIIYNLLS